MAALVICATGRVLVSGTVVPLSVNLAHAGIQRLPSALKLSLTPLPLKPQAID